MSYYPLLAVLTLAAFFTGAGLASLGVTAVWPRLRRRSAALAPGHRARLLFSLRAAPALTGLATSTALALAFVRHEPRGATEFPGMLLVVSAAATVAFLSLMFLRAGRATGRTIAVNRLAARCQGWTSADGTPVTVVQSSYPVAAIVGLFRARFLVSTRILKECTAEEIEIILSHERAHVRRRDNLARAILAVLPDPLMLTRTGADLERHWATAAEEAADAAAAGNDDGRRTALAGVLVRIAGLTDSAPPAWMPALGFYQGENLQRRVAALLGTGPFEAATRRLARPALLLSVLALAAAAHQLSPAIHHGLEWAIRAIP